MIIVCPLSAVQRLAEDHGAKSVISLLGPDTAHRPFNGIDSSRHLKLTFHDITEPVDGFSAPRPEDTRKIISFIETWDRSAPMIIHCWAGISRSTAAAFTALCVLRPDQGEDRIGQELRRMSPSATPNRLIVSQADAILGRKGRMIAATDAIGRGREAYEGVPFILRP